MEQRHGEDDGRRIRGHRRRAAHRGGHFGIHGHGDGAAALPAEQCVDDGAVGGEHALGMRGGTGGVEDGGVVLWVDGGFGHGGAAGLGQKRLPGGVAGMLVAHGYQRDAEFVHAVGQALGALAVREQQVEAAVLHAVGQLVPGPPGVHGHRDAAGAGDAHERGHPLRIIAQRDADAIPRPDAAARQRVGAAGREFPHLAVGVALVAVDVEILVAVFQPAGVQRPQMRWRVGEHGEVHAADALGARLVGLARRGDLRHRGGQIGLHLPHSAHPPRWPKREVYTIQARLRLFGSRQAGQREGDP